jgi:cytochrome c oxidase cbb3-type subunit 4
MSATFADVVWFAKTFGLFYFIGLSVVVVAWAYWPSHRKRYDAAAASILQPGEDRPWR